MTTWPAACLFIMSTYLRYQQHLQKISMTSAQFVFPSSCLACATKGAFQTPLFESFGLCVCVPRSFYLLLTERPRDSDRQQVRERKEARKTFTISSLHKVCCALYTCPSFDTNNNALVRQRRIRKLCIVGVEVIVWGDGLKKKNKWLKGYFCF